MADAYTGTGQVGWDTAAYEGLMFYALRPQKYFDQVADVRPTRQTHPGASVQWFITADITAQTTALTETTTPDSVALSDSTVVLTLEEHGMHVKTTAKLRGTSLFEVDPVAANTVGENAGLSIDTLARTVLQAGDNVRYAASKGSRAALDATAGSEDKLLANDVRRALADLRVANAAVWSGGLYAAFIHPDVSYDLRGETGAAAWRDPHTYSQPAEIWNGEVGAFEGFRFIETPRAPVFADTGSPSTVDVYATLFMGREALAKAWSIKDGNGPDPQLVMGPITDPLRRFHNIGWYWLGDHGIFRQATLRRVESVSTIGAN